MKKYRSVNPKTGVLIKEFECISDAEMMESLEKAFKLYEEVLYDPEPRKALLKRIAKLKKLYLILEQRKTELARLITDEMGKPIAQSKSEIDKALSFIDFYIKNGEDFQEEEHLDTDSYKECFISHQPLGPCLSKATGS
jgi:succinate-semialdehyde dehydrogenase/glutarate-semialdehyde dehydrogenase